jgi:hypothetical protein
VEQLDLRVLKVFKELLDLLVRKVLQGLVVQQVRQVQLVHLLLDLQVRKV